MFNDSGLAAFLAAGADADASAGRLIENLVLGELARQLTWTDFSVRLYHYRDRDQNEVDAILEDNAGTIVGVAVKAGETVRADDFRGLRMSQRRLGERFRAGFVLYLRRRVAEFRRRVGSPAGVGAVDYAAGRVATQAPSVRAKL